MEKVWEAQKGKRKMVLYVGPEEEGLCQSNKTVPETDKKAKEEEPQASKGTLSFFVYLLQLILKSDFAKRQFETPDNI